MPDIEVIILLIVILLTVLVGAGNIYILKSLVAIGEMLVIVGEMIEGIKEKDR